MRKVFELSSLTALVVLSAAGAAHAGALPVPAPLLGAGPVGLAVLAAAGVGYVAVRKLRKRR